MAKGGKSALPELLKNDVIIEGKDLLKVTGVSTAFGTSEAAYKIMKRLLAGEVTYISKESLARVRGLISALAKQPSEALRPGYNLWNLVRAMQYWLVCPLQIGSQ